MRTTLARRPTTLPPYAGLAVQDRTPAVAEALARLEHACAHRDPDAAARILDQLPTTDDGAWILRQMAAAGLRALADTAATLA